MIDTTIFRYEPRADRDRADLETVVDALNRVLPNQLSDEDHKALVDYVELWNRSGRAPWKEPFHSATEGRAFKVVASPFPADVMKMLANMPDEGAADKDPFREERVEDAEGKQFWQRHRTRFSRNNVITKGAFEDHPFSEEMIKDADGKRFWQQHHARFSRQNVERAFNWIIMAVPAGGCWYKAYSGPLDPAVLLAANLLGNTLSAKLSDGPCPRCKQWFVKKRAVQKCCSKRCATAFNNTVGVQLRRAAHHEEQLGRARAALKACKKAERRSDWRQFVSKQTGLTPRFLTRAVNKGELRAPRITKKRRKT